MRVSTTFFGIEITPQHYFETAVFIGGEMVDQARYHTLAEARSGHASRVKLFTGATALH